MNVNRKIVILMLVLLLIILAVACQPAPTVAPYVAPAQTEGTVHLEGDSVTFNTYYGTTMSLDYTTSSSYVPGSTIDANWSGEAAIDRVPRLLNEGKVDTLVWALGLNEVYLEGWSLRYQLLWTDLLFQKIPSSSCIVMVKPWVLPSNYDKRPLDQMEALRSWIDQQAETHPNVVTVDWKPILEAHPEFSVVDGVHIDSGTDGALWRDAMYRDGVAQCN